LADVADQVAQGIESQEIALEPLLTVPQVAETLAVSPRTVWSLLQKDEIRSVSVGRSRRIPASELERYISQALTGGIA
jgi:excisionase family DNA binding protein